MTYTFTKASKHRARARVALIGPSGSGKTYTALAIASALGGKIAVIDTEHGSASKYADLFTFDVLELGTFSPLTYVDAMKAAEGYDVLVIDSLSHAWMGKDGALEQVDRAAKRSPSGNSFAAWRDVTPMHNRLVEALVAHPAHLLVTMRSKTEYVLDKDDRGKTTPRKVGTAPVQRDGLEYEFDVVADLDLDHNMVVAKTRCPALDGQVFAKAGADVAAVLTAWLTDGDEVRVVPAEPTVRMNSEDAAEAAHRALRESKTAGKTLAPVEIPGTVADEPGSWRQAISDSLPDDLGALLPAIDAEPNTFRRMAALRLLATAIAENGTPAQIKAAGAEVKAWPKGRDGRMEIIGMLMAALEKLAVTA